MPTIKYLKSGEISEETIQKTVIEWVNWHPYLNKRVIHIPNEGKRTKQFGKKLQDMGMTAGVWDLLITIGRHGYIGAWIELKSADGRLTKAQKEFGETMRQENYFTAVCWSIDEVINTIQWYCFDKPSPKPISHQDTQALF